MPEPSPREERAEQHLGEKLHAHWRAEQLLLSVSTPKQWLQQQQNWSNLWVTVNCLQVSKHGQFSRLGPMADTVQCSTLDE